MMNKMHASVAVVVSPVLFALVASGVLLTFAASGASRAMADDGARRPGERRDVVVYANAEEYASGLPCPVG